MIYFVHSKKFQSYLRFLTTYERVKLVYNTEIDKSMHRRTHEEHVEKGRHYGDWDTVLPELYMQMHDHPTWWKRKVDEEKKQQQRY